MYPAITMIDHLCAGLLGQKNEDVTRTALKIIASMKRDWMQVTVHTHTHTNTQKDRHTQTHVGYGSLSGLLHEL